jgi:nucleoid-associated protein YgaU
MQFRTTAPQRADNPAQTAHARRRRRAAAAVATTVGAAAVVGTTFAVPADAASRFAVWDRVASCESSQRWHISTGNGFYGGLQFTASTWAAYHGHKYARQANRASRLEQIEVARRVLASQGPGAWPVCGPRAGLTRFTGHATHARLPRVAGGTNHATHTRVSAKAAKRHAHKHAHKHARHHAKSRHHHRHVYTVRAGDTLSAIAHKLHVPGGWHALYRANRKHLANPNLLHIGQRLLVP